MCICFILFFLSLIESYPLKNLGIGDRHELITENKPKQMRSQEKKGRKNMSKENLYTKDHAEWAYRET